MEEMQIFYSFECKCSCQILVDLKLKQKKIIFLVKAGGTGLSLFPIITLLLFFFL